MIAGLRTQQAPQATRRSAAACCACFPAQAGRFLCPYFMGKGFPASRQRLTASRSAQSRFRRRACIFLRKAHAARPPPSAQLPPARRGPRVSLCRFFGGFAFFVPLFSPYTPYGGYNFPAIFAIRNETARIFYFFSDKNSGLSLPRNGFSLGKYLSRGEGGRGRPRQKTPAAQVSRAAAARGERAVMMEGGRGERRTESPAADAPRLWNGKQRDTGLSAGVSRYSFQEVSFLRAFHATNIAQQIVSKCLNLFCGRIFFARLRPAVQLRGVFLHQFLIARVFHENVQCGVVVAEYSRAAHIQAFRDLIP